MKNTLFISKFGNVDEWKCRGTFNTTNNADYKFMSKSRFLLLINFKLINKLLAFAIGYLSMTNRNFDSKRIFLEISPVLSGFVSVIMIMMLFIYHTGSKKKSWYLLRLTYILFQISELNLNLLLVSVSKWAAIIILEQFHSERKSNNR